MKKNTFLANIGRIYIAVALFATFMLSSCLKDKSPGSVDYSKSPALVGWQYTGFSPTPYTGAIFGKSTDSVTLQITLSVASLTLKTPVTVTLAPDPDYLSAYNLANSANYIQLDPSQYTLPGGTSFTIKPGQQIVNYVIHLQGQNVDFSKSNAIALKITSATGAVVATNLNEVIALLKLKSIYEDTYVATSGATTRYFGANVASGLRDVFTIPPGTVIPYSTVSVNTISGEIGSSSFGLTGAITLTGTTVTVSADPNGTVGSNTFNFIQGNSKGGSSYDPASKTITIHCSYLNGAGALREVDMVLVGQ